MRTMQNGSAPLVGDRLRRSPTTLRRAYLTNAEKDAYGFPLDCPTLPSPLATATAAVFSCRPPPDSAR